MKLSDVRDQLVDGRSRQAESERPDHGEAVFQCPVRTHDFVHCRDCG